MKIWILTLLTFQMKKMILIYYHCEEVEKYLMQYYEKQALNIIKEELSMMKIILFKNVLMNVPKQLNTNQEKIMILKNIVKEISDQLVRRTSYGFISLSYSTNP